MFVWSVKLEDEDNLTRTKRSTYSPSLSVCLHLSVSLVSVPGSNRRPLGLEALPMLKITD